MIDVAVVLWNFFLEHFWSIMACIGVIFYGKKFHEKYIFTPLAGGNGKIQIDELAKGIIMAILVWSVNRDGYRTHEWTYFSDAYYAVLIAGLFAIAAIQPVTSMIINKNGTNTNNKQTLPKFTDGNSSAVTGNVDT